jgi:hypothetical protein
MATTIDEILQEKQALRPAQGFAVVGLDDYGSPDEQGLFLVAVVATPEDAKDVLSGREGDGTRYFIYAADGTVVDAGDAPKETD